MTTSVLDSIRSMEVLSPSQLKRLKEHKYSAEGKSVTEPVMQIFWCWLVEQVPRTLAPNAITLIGLAANVFSALILVYYCPTATEEAPGWVYAFAAVCLFIYQSLDAIDGKQARRTNSSTQLGELFDHGCDSVSIVFVSVSVSCALQLGYNPPLNFVLGMVAMFMYYTAHWQTYVSGTLKFGKLDVTEGQLIFCSCFMVSAFKGGAFWASRVPVLDIEMKTAICGFGAFCSILSLYNYSRVIFGGGKGRNGSTVADTSVIAPFFHIGTVVLLAFAIWQKSKSQLYEREPCIYYLMFGIVSAKITNKLVVAHMTRSGMSYLDSAFIGPGMLFINQYLDTVVPESTVLWVALVWCTFDLVRYCTALCWQISQHLGIYTFDITRKPQQPDQRTGVMTRRQAKLAGH